MVAPTGSSKRLSVPCRQPCRVAGSGRSMPALAGEHGQQRIVPQFIVIVEIFVAQRHAIHALTGELATECSTSLGSLAIAETSASRRRRSNSARPRPAAGRRRRTSAPRRRTRPQRDGLPPVQTRSVLRYTPFASGHASKSAQVVLAKQLLPNSEARCATLFEKCGLRSGFGPEPAT